ncbi:Thaumatin protein [Spatholobus suberectus]|nr:Thaumatin protein [Spatholobus suberectus]
MQRRILTLLLTILLLPHISGVSNDHNAVQQVSPPSVTRDPAQRRKAHPGPRRLPTSPQPGPAPSRSPRSGWAACDGLGGAPPATLAELTLDDDRDFYDVSLVDGYNLPVAVTAVTGSGRCRLRGLREGPQRHVPRGPAGALTCRSRGCVQERVLRLQLPEVVLHWQLWKPTGLRAHRLFQNLQGRLS